MYILLYNASSIKQKEDYQNPFSDLIQLGQKLQKELSDPKFSSQDFYDILGEFQVLLQEVHPTTNYEKQIAGTMNCFFEELNQIDVEGTIDPDTRAMISSIADSMVSTGTASRSASYPPLDKLDPLKQAVMSYIALYRNPNPSKDDLEAGIQQLLSTIDHLPILPNNIEDLVDALKSQALGAKNLIDEDTGQASWYLKSYNSGIDAILTAILDPKI